MTETQGPVTDPTAVQGQKDIHVPLLTGTEADGGIGQILADQGGDEVTVLGGDRPISLSNPTRAKKKNGTWGEIKKLTNPN